MKTNHDDGFTGLEAAIVLIAFIVVAAVFSYVVLGAGFFTTQKAQETVHTGVAQATSAVELSGPVMIDSSADDTVGNITFYLQLAAGGTPVDIDKIIYTISTPRKTETVSFDSDNPGPVYALWVKTIQTGKPDPLLENREMVLMRISLADMNWDSGDATKNDKLMVEVKPPVGAAYPISRTLPPALVKDKTYEVF